MRNAQTRTHDGSGYGIGKTGGAILGAGLLLAGNIALMFALAPTALAEGVVWLFDTAPGAPWGGVILVSVLLSVGRLAAYTSLGYDAMDPEETTVVRDVSGGLAAVGLAVTLLAFGLFGGAALSIVPADTRLLVVGISLVVTLGLAAVIGGIELLTTRSIAPYGAVVHGVGMVGGLGLLAVGYVGSLLGISGASYLYVGAFALILLAWIGDLAHEIGVLTRDDRPVWVNAYGLYAATTGVFVHILWLVARAYAEGN